MSMRPLLNAPDTRLTTLQQSDVDETRGRNSSLGDDPDDEAAGRDAYTERDHLLGAHTESIRRRREVGVRRGEVRGRTGLDWIGPW